MKKIIFTFNLLVVLALAAPPVFSSPFISAPDSGVPNTKDKKDALSIGSNRATGALELHFTAAREGEAVIAIISEAGKIVLQQTSRVKASDNSIPVKNGTGLAEGAYLLQLTANNETYTARFMIWK